MLYKHMQHFLEQRYSALCILAIECLDTYGIMYGFYAHMWPYRMQKAIIDEMNAYRQDISQNNGFLLKYGKN